MEQEQIYTPYKEQVLVTDLDLSIINLGVEQVLGMVRKDFSIYQGDDHTVYSAKNKDYEITRVESRIDSAKNLTSVVLAPSSEDINLRYFTTIGNGRYSFSHPAIVFKNPLEADVRRLEEMTTVEADSAIDILRKALNMVKSQDRG